MVKSLDFKSGFMYPFNRPIGLLNVLWLLVPIFGWLALSGYSARIVNEFISGEFKQLPKMEFWNNFKLGILLLVKSIPFLIVYVGGISILSYFFSEVFLQILELLLQFFVFPVLFVNFLVKQTVASYFEFPLIKSIFTNFSDYSLALIKTIGLFLICMVLVLVLVGLPVFMFTYWIFFADFYRRFVIKAKKKKKKLSTKKE